MTRKSAATVQTPGASAAKSADESAKKTKAPASNVAEQAKAYSAKGPVDPTALKQPVFVDGQGWVCPAKLEQITVDAPAETGADEDDGEEADED